MTPHRGQLMAPSVSPKTKNPNRLDSVTMVSVSKAGWEMKDHDNPPCYLLLWIDPFWFFGSGSESCGFNDPSLTSLRIARLERGQDRRNTFENTGYAHGKCGCRSGAWAGRRRLSAASTAGETLID